MSLTAEQIKIRIGRFNASTLEVLCKQKGLGDGAETYIYEKIAERETGLVKEIITSKSIQWGIDHEDEAIERLGSVLDIKLVKNEQSSVNEEYNLSGTPDVINLELRTGAEIKCPDSKTHVRFAKMKNGNELKVVEPGYWWQIVSYMFLLNVDSWLFVSYDPRMIDPKKQIYVFTIKRNETEINFLKDRLSLSYKLLKQYSNEI